MAGTITPVTMPKFGLAMTEGKVAGWLVHPGDKVTAGQELAEIETTKITNVYESPAAGILRRQVADTGDMLAVGALIGVLADEGASDADIDAFIETFKNENESASAGEKADDTSSSTVISVGSRQIRVQDSGKAEGDTLPLLLIHGFGGDLTNWMLNQGALASQTRVIAFDLPGHGESSKDVGDGSPATLASITKDLLNALGIERVHVAGHSLGGAIALELAKAHPGAVASLTLLAPAGVGETINGAFIEGFISADRRKTLEPILQMLVHDKELISRRMVEGIIRFKRLDGVIAGLTSIANASFDGNHQKENLRSVLESYDGPISIIWGADDEILPASGADGLSEKVGVQILPGVGHMPQMEKSADVNDQFAKAVAG